MENAAMRQDGAPFDAPVCMAALAGRTLADLYQRNLQLENVEYGSRNEKISTLRTYREGEIKHLWDRIYSTHEFILSVPALTVEGALYQVGILDIFFNRMKDVIDKRSEAEEFEQTIRAFQRGIYSVFRAIACASGIPATPAYEWLMGDNLDPWAPHEDRVAKIQKEQANG